MFMTAVAGRMAAFTEGQPKMIPQRFTIEHRVEIAALFEDRQDIAGKVLEAFGDHREAEDEAVSGPAIHPADDLVGDMIRRADKGSPRRSDVERDLTKRQALVARRGLDAVGGRSEVVAADIADIRESLVERIDAEIVVVEEAAEIEQRFLYRDQLSDRLILCFRFLRGRADDRADTGIDAYFGGCALVRDHAVFQLPVEGPCLLERTAVREDGIGVLAGKADARIGGARLEDHRLPLLRAADVQRPLDAEE